VTIASVTNDYAGTARPQGAAYDLGAYEYVAADTTPPTVTNVSSDKANGTYGVGTVIDIDVTFSEAVTSTGNVTVTLETGDTDRTCTFTVSSATTGTCNYTVQVGTIAGTIADAASNAMVDFTPATNLAANKALVIDGTAPTVSTVVIGTNGTSWTFTYSEAVTCSSTPNCCDDFVVSMSGQGPVTLSYSEGSTTSTVLCTGNKTVRANETVSVGLNYTTVSNGIEDVAGNDLATFTSKAVTNNSVVPFAPILIDVEKN
jgi:hypothetical protein